MKWAVLTERATDAIGHAVIVEADSALEAAQAGQQVFEQEAEGETVCQDCDQPYPTDVYVLLIEAEYVFKPERTLVEK